jgi:hypothetical protein
MLTMSRVLMRLNGSECIACEVAVRERCMMIHDDMGGAPWAEMALADVAERVRVVDGASVNASLRLLPLHDDDAAACGPAFDEESGVIVCELVCARAESCVWYMD